MLLHHDPREDYKTRTYYSFSATIAASPRIKCVAMAIGIEHSTGIRSADISWDILLAYPIVDIFVD